MGLNFPPDYSEFLTNLKARIRQSQARAALSVNSEMIQLYHHIGKEILRRQTQEKWGAKIIEHIAIDLKESFPAMKGFSSSNIKYMRYFAENCPDLKFGQQPADQLPWFHIVTILTKVPSAQKREWYAGQAIANSWSRLMLDKEIKSNLIARQGQAVTNFKQNLPDNSQAAHQILKDPYMFDFLGLGDEASEREIESGLINHITHFLLELGSGFAFVGRQYKLEVNGDCFFIDLFFYHTKLKCFIVVELKKSEFKPEHVGQLNFYLSAVDAQVKDESDAPTIGILLCKEKNHLVAQYALNGVQKPIGVAEYQLVKNLPARFVNQLPSVEELETQLSESEYEKAPPGFK